MKKILLVTNIPAPYTVDLIYYIQTHVHDYQFHVLYTGRNEDDREWQANADRMLNTTFVQSRILKVNTRFDHRYIHLPGRIGKELKSIDPDIIIAWEYNLAAIQCLQWCKSHHRKYISLTEGTLLTEQNLWFIQKLTRWYIKNNADAFLVSGTKAREKLLAWGVSNKKIFTEYLTVDTDIYLNATRRTQNGRLLFVGRFTERKGLDLLFKALAHTKSPYNLHIVGGGTQEEKSDLIDLAKQIGINNQIIWCGYKSGKDLVKEYMEADAFVLPTREDCFGLVLLEALASRLPILASKYADGAYDIVEENINGLIVDPYDEQAFAESIDKILKFDKHSVEKASLRIANKFSFFEVTKGYVDAIKYVICQM